MVTYQDYDKLTNTTNSKQDLSGSMMKNYERYNQMKDETDTMKKNQDFMNDYIENEYNIINKNKNNSLTNIYNNKRHLDINAYYYKKNKAQLKILYDLCLVIIVIIILTLLNKKFSFIFNDTVYIILVGLISGVYIIYLIYQLYDIFVRSTQNFDEYEYHFNKNLVNKKCNS